MLLNFSVSNYKIFRDRTTLSMEASADKSHSDSVLHSDIVRRGVLSSALLYGANATGKTKFLEAIELMRNFVLNSSQHMIDAPLNFTPFGYDPHCAKLPTSFEMDFISNGTRYVYGFSYDRKQITEEHLISYSKQRKKTVFVRSFQKFEFPSDRREKEVISKRVRGNVLFISVAAQFNHSDSIQVYQWFQNGLLPMVNSPFMVLNHTLAISKKNPKFKELVLKAARIADLGVTDIYERGDNHRERNAIPSSGAFLSFPGEIYVAHNANGRRMDLPLEQESSGTQRFLDIIGPAIDALMNGRTFVVDELDLSFHTDICEWLVGLFNDPCENRKNAQIIFNTHDVELMDQELVRRDQIWFSVKDPDTYEAELRRMSDFGGVRKDLNIRKAYLNGSFGAKPFIEPERLMEDE